MIRSDMMEWLHHAELRCISLPGVVCGGSGCARRRLARSRARAPEHQRQCHARRRQVPDQAVHTASQPSPQPAEHRPSAPPRAAHTAAALGGLRRRPARKHHRDAGDIPIIPASTAAAAAAAAARGRHRRQRQRQPQLRWCHRRRPWVLCRLDQGLQLRRLRYAHGHDRDAVGREWAGAGPRVAAAAAAINSCWGGRWGSSLRALTASRRSSRAVPSSMSDTLAQRRCPGRRAAAAAPPPDGGG
jgi:hypothetical protein